jgi:hypothetical protein
MQLRVVKDGASLHGTRSRKATRTVSEMPLQMWDKFKVTRACHTTAERFSSTAYWQDFESY